MLTLLIFVARGFGLFWCHLFTIHWFFFCPWQVYADLSAKIAERGVERTATQCQNKLKNLRQVFNQRRQDLSASGGGYLDPLTHQTLLEELYGSRPSADAPFRAFDATFASVLREDGLELEGKNPVNDT